VSCVPWNPVGCASDIAKSVAGDAFDSIAHDFAKAADSAVNWLWAQTSTATAIHLGGSGFQLDLGIVATIAVTVAVGLFVIQLIGTTLRRDPGGLARAVKGLLVAFIGGGAAIAVTNILLAAVDSLSAGVVRAATGDTISQLGHSILAGGSITAATSNPAAVILLSLVALAAVVLVWAALMVRKVLVVVSAVFAPMAFAGALSDITSSWVRRWIEVTVALIVSKLALVLIFVIGLGMFVRSVGQAGTGSTQVITQVISGLLVLILAGFAPWLSLKLVHWSGDQFHHLHAMAATSASGAQKVIRAPQKAAPWATRAVAAGATGGAVAGMGAAAGGGAATLSATGVDIPGPPSATAGSHVRPNGNGHRTKRPSVVAADSGAPAAPAPVPSTAEGDRPAGSRPPLSTSSAARSQS
jgi:hypothetical protein